MRENGLHVEVRLSSESAGKLARIAARSDARPEDVAGFLLGRALDDADCDPAGAVELLDRIPGAWDRIEAGVADARAGHTIPLDEL